MNDAEIVRALAERVMGWHQQAFWPNTLWQDANGITTAYAVHVSADSETIYPAWNPLTSDADSCAVLDRMGALGWEYNLIWRKRRPPDADAAEYAACNFEQGEVQAGEFCVGSPNGRRRAIARAALKAVGGLDE